jgi:hypothetical protein
MCVYVSTGMPTRHDGGEVEGVHASPPPDKEGPHLDLPPVPTTIPACQQEACTSRRTIQTREYLCLQSASFILGEYLCVEDMRCVPESRKRKDSGALPQWWKRFTHPLGAWVK